MNKEELITELELRVSGAEMLKEMTDVGSLERVVCCAEHSAYLGALQLASQLEE